jgi:hypothetical protein
MIDLDFPLKSGRGFASEKLRERMIAHFGAPLVCAEFEKAAIWLEANPQKRPVYIDRFLAKWMLKVKPPLQQVGIFKGAAIPEDEVARLRAVLR